MEGIADYTFIRPLGEGNHGRYFLAAPPERLNLDLKLVAVKVMAAAITDDAFRRATRELRLFSSLESRFLVTLFDAGQEDQVFYYAMEYLPLGSLANPARPLDRAERLRAVADAARAADALHEAGIVHRDIKPENILIDETGAKLSDLGLAQHLSPGLTITGIGHLSTVEYVDPAIMRGERASRASDIWSLGITLHRTLAGAGVYGELPDDDPLLAMRRVLSSQPTLDPSLSDAEASLITACLEPDPANRLPTAASVAARIDQL